MAKRSFVRRCVSVMGGLLLAAVITGAIVPALRARAIKLVRPRVGVAERVAEIGPAARERMRGAFARAGVAYPPVRVVLAGFKAERRMEVYAPAADGGLRRVLEYPMLGASGKAGPKLREGDYQVPEGVYPIASLNPNSLYDVALRVGYPSAEDWARAREDGREHLGGDIMIHGGSGSVGCVAMGDGAAEELFVLAADVGIERVEVWLCPVDFRDPAAKVTTEGLPGWVRGRYDDLQLRLKSLQ